jgi:lipopolysaccharide transport system ATP-binding protein
MAEPAVLFDRVWKKFRRGEHHDSLRDLIPFLARRLLRRRRAAEEERLAREEFWAVRDVSFEVPRGESLGIIGPNGAGKSTILKLLTRILRPTLGRCAVTGRVGALIEVAAGFHPDLTGRENVYLQGTIMGMKRAEISRNFERIVEFAGVREFIDTPVKRYSSGMNARLGFAIAAHLDPDVLIIDEVLSVGDAAFQEKCVARMRELVGQGIPLVFVSHNLQAVQSLCRSTVVIDHGQAVYQGASPEAIHQYRRRMWSPPDRQARPARRPGDVWIRAVRLIDGRGEPAEMFRTGEAMTVRVSYEASGPLNRAHFGVDLHRADGVYCYGINTNMDGQDLGPLGERGAVELHLPFLSLLPGSYTLSVGIMDRDGIAPLDVQNHAHHFSVAWDGRAYGVVHMDHEWRRLDAESEPAVPAGKEASNDLG